jgi:hypothetical protein
MSRPARARAPIPFPFQGKILRQNQANNPADVTAVQQRLNATGCGPVPETGRFDNVTFNAVKLFQSRFTDVNGVPLEIDGDVGGLTWGALFGPQSLPVTRDTQSPLLDAVLAVASRQIGVMESPPGSNRGPEVDRYLQSVGLDPKAGSFAWCVAFIYFCFDSASKQLKRDNPMIRTAGVLDHWNRAGRKGVPRITAENAATEPGLVKPGQIFVIDTGKGLGHSGLVETVTGSSLVTIEGNTNDGGSRDGVGVFRRSMRKIPGINKGFVDYGAS